MADKVIDYIKANWEKTMNPPNEKVPFPFNSPSMVFYTDFYYWDLYFINKGLLLSGLHVQAENNIKNMVFFINKQGFIPNSTAPELNNRSQPPVFPLALFDLYKYRKDKKVIEDYIDAVIKEHEFFQTRRMTSIGLNAFMCDELTYSPESIKKHYKYLSPRVSEYSDNEEEQYQIGKDIIAIAESGLDFNMRFKTEKSKIAAHEFAHLDLNCWLFAGEIAISKMLSIVDRKEEAEHFLSLANKRKELMDKYFLEKESGLYKDYHLEDGKHSQIITACNLYPYAMGVSNDPKGCLKVLKDLEMNNGLSTAKYRGENEIYYQWDYPVMWGETVYIAYLALKNVGLDKDAERIKDKYLNTVKKQFDLTGCLWEKYDARDGSIMNIEYDAPPFMGWTAGTYQLFSTLDSDLIKII